MKALVFLGVSMLLAFPLALSAAIKLPDPLDLKCDAEVASAIKLQRKGLGNAPRIPKHLERSYAASLKSQRKADKIGNCK